MAYLSECRYFNFCWLGVNWIEHCIGVMHSWSKFWVLSFGLGWYFKNLERVKAPCIREFPVDLGISQPVSIWKAVNPSFRIPARCNAYFCTQIMLMRASFDPRFMAFSSGHFSLSIDDFAPQSPGRPRVDPSDSLSSNYLKLSRGLLTIFNRLNRTPPPCPATLKQEAPRSQIRVWTLNKPFLSR